MNGSDFDRIRHIKQYCDDIDKTIKRFGADPKIFMTDIDYYKSVSMSIVQIGELSVGLTDEFKSKTGEQMQWGLIRGMRNMFAHTYSKMDKETVWDVAEKDIPKLLKFCNGVIDSNQDNLTR